MSRILSYPESVLRGMHLGNITLHLKLLKLTREEFEAGYRTKELAGFHWLSLGDFCGQNSAPVGFTDAFYDTKTYVDPAYVREWNAPTVLLACMDKRILTTNEIFNAKIKFVEISLSGPSPCPSPRPRPCRWRVIFVILDILD